MPAHQPHHDGSPSYLDNPAPDFGEEVGLRVHVPHLADGTPAADSAWVRWVHDGEPRFVAAELERRDEAGSTFRVAITADNPVTNYRFLLRGPAYDLAWLNGTGLHQRDVTDVWDFRIVAGQTLPDWVADQVVYQVFPDRFNRSAGADRRAANLPEWAEPAGWDDPVIHQGFSTGRQFYGGDLDGVAARLDHLETLGATALYLTPVFQGRSNHRYDATSFDHVDPLLGGDESFDRLLAVAHHRGLRVLGDLTTNHTGVEHEWFVAALADPDGVRAGYYRFGDEHPYGYATWLGISTLPRLDHSNAALRRELYEGPGSVVHDWIKRGLDGWRIDVANMTGRMGSTDLNAAVARAVRATAQAADPQAWVLAEHGHDAARDLAVGGWHGVMDYAGFTRPLWTWLATDLDEELAWTILYLGVPVPVPHLPGSAVATAIREVHAGMPWSSWSLSSAHLDSHDTPRFRTIVGGGASGGVDAAGRGRDRHLVGVALQQTLPGVPTVFMGDEIGLTAANGEHARTPFPWQHRDRWDEPTWQAYRAWIALRRNHIALRRGGLRWLHTGTDSLTFVREHPEQRVLVHVARGAHPPVRVPLRLLGLRDGSQLVPLLGEPVDGEALPSAGPAAHAYLLDG